MATRRATATANQSSTFPQPDPGRWHESIRSLELSPQKTRIVGLILQGKGDKEIASDLDLSKHTVRTYLNRIFARLGVADRVGLVVHVACPHALCAHPMCPHKQ